MENTTKATDSLDDDAIYANIIQQSDHSDDTAVRRTLQTIFMPCMCSIIFVLGLVGNLLVLVIFIFYEKLSSITDVFLVNLATADILFLCTLPFLAYSAADEWIFGSFMCKTITGIYNINLYTSMLTLTCITVERFIAIVQATKALRLQRKIRIWGKVICFAVWAIAILLTIPQFIFSKYSGSLCLQHYDPPYIELIVRGFQMTAGFFVPLLAMIICYSVIIKTIIKARGLKKQKSLKIIGAIVAVFIATQLPYNIVIITSYIKPGMFNTHFVRALIITETTAYTHACLNPILYCFMGVRFRKNFWKIVKDCGCVKHQLEVSNQLKSTEDHSKTNSASANAEHTSMFRL